MPEQDVSFLDLNLEENPDLGPVPAGEYELLLKNATRKYGTRDDGTAWGRIQTVHEVVGEDTADDIFHNLWLPMEDDEPKAQIRSKSIIKEFMEAHGIDISAPFKPEDWTGMGYSCYAILKEDEYDGRPINRIQRFVVSA